ncbi:MAG: tetratricopeptide repeat protein [Bacteroidota bacterium]
MKKYLVSVLLLLSALYAFPQSVVEQVDSLLLNSDYAGAIALVDKNIEQQKNPEDQIILADKKAEALIHMGKYNEAEALIKALQSKSDRTPFARSIIETNYGFLYMNQGRYDLALEALQKALTLLEEAGKSGTLEAAQTLSYLGQVYKSTGKNTQAEEQMQMTLAIRQSKLSENHELIAASYNDLGFVYSIIDNDKALDYYEKALAIYEKLHGKSHPKIAFANTNIGIIYRELELYGDAVNNFDTALKIWEKVYTQAHPTKAFVLYNLAETYREMRDATSAKAFYQKALAMFQSSFGPKHPEVARVLHALGNLDLSASNYDEAIGYYQQSLQANVSDFNSADEAVNPSLKNFYHGNVLLYTLLAKAQALEARHFGKTLKFTDLTRGLATLQTCDSLIDKLRQQSANESDKISLGVIANEVYADGVRMAHGAAQVALKKRPYLDLAFYFAEKSKSAVLLEAISDAEAKSFAGIPADLLEEEKNLKSAIALTAQKLAQKPTAEEEKYLRETSFSLNRQYETFVKRLEKEFPQYFNLKFNSSIPSVAQIQNLLDAKTAVLSYFIDDKNAKLYTFVITQKSYRIVEHTLPKEFDRYITGLRNSLFFNELKTYKLAAMKLSDILIPKIPGTVSDLVILSTGRLSIIPFETLLTKKDEDATSYQSLPYLLNRYSFRYEFSAGLMLQKSKDRQQTNNPSIFLCAPVSFPEKDHLNELPGSESEVKEIAKLFQEKKYNSVLYTRREADEKLVKTGSLKDYRLLHFATHGVVDENSPELSRIFLQTSSDAEDGNLFAGEIYNLELDASLVTLSACQTGLGKISKGEGVIGLSRALVYAGAKNIIVSFWSVADESTADLMKNFYRLMLENNNGYSTNLRRAKLDLIKTGKYAAPYYWAPFVLIGY